MKIVEIVVRYSPYVGGVENSVRSLSRGLRDLGHEVVIVCADEPRGSPATVDGLRVVRLPWRVRIGQTHLSRGVVRAVIAERPDVVHGHMTPPWWIDQAAAAARETRRPFVVTYNNDVVGSGPLAPVAALYNRFFLPRTLATADRIVLPNDRLRETSPALARLAHREGRDRFVPIPWGVDLARFRPPVEPSSSSGDPSQRSLRVGFLALLDRAHDYKGLDDLLEAVAIARRRASESGEALDLRLSVAGAGDQLDRFARRAAALGLEPFVDFLGFVGEERLAAFYAGCDLFALPSRSLSQEGFGLVLLEAMACGRPVVSTTIPQAAQSVRSAEAGWVTAPGDPPSLARALLEAARDPAERARRGRNARALVESRYGWPAIAGAYEELFLQLDRRVA